MAWAEKYVTPDSDGGDGSAENPWTMEEAIAGVAAGDRVNVKAGSYPNMGADYAFATAGTTTAPIWWRGYKTTIGDKDTAGGTRVVGTDLPLWNADTSSDQVVVSGAHQIFSNIALTSICTDSGGAMSLTGGNIRLLRCVIENTKTGQANARAVTSATTHGNVLIGCSLKATTGAGYVAYHSVGAQYIGCRIVGGAVGIGAESTGDIYNSIIDGFATTGLRCYSASAPISLLSCSVYSSSGTQCVLISTLPTTGHIRICNTILGGCTYGIYNAGATATNGISLMRVHFYSCTTNIGGSSITELGTYDSDLGIAYLLIDDDTDPWVDKANGNFTLASTNTVDKRAGYPGLFEGQTAMTGYPDIGAVQLYGDYPAAGNVTEDDYTDGTQGTYHEATAAEVQNGVQFGADGTEYTGTYSGGSGGAPHYGDRSGGKN